MPACRPPPGCVHCWVSTQPGPPSKVQVSSRPMSSPPSVRLSGSLVRTRLSGHLVSSPSGVQPSGVCPSARSQPSGPASAGWWRWGRPRDGGQRSCRIESSSRWSGLSLAAGSTAPRRHGCRYRCGGRVQAGGGASAADLVGWCLGGRLHPTGQQASLPPGAHVAGDCARAGVGWRDVAHGTARRPAGLEPRLLCVVIAEPEAEWTGPEGAYELGGADGARPQRGPAR
jgi:hypothetical protein